jgi:hypothetical protein
MGGWQAPHPVAVPNVTAPTTQSEPAGPTTPAATNYTYLPMVLNKYVPNYTPPFGIVMYTTVNDAAGEARMLAAGSHWFTTDLLWANVEPAPPVGNVHTYFWASLDDDARNVQAAGGEMYVLINRNPAWASAYPSGPVTNTADLTAFATAVVERYDGDGVDDAPGHPVIRYWSWYAEPDNGAAWAALSGKGYFGHNPTGYANLLMAASTAMKAASPQAKVLVGGVAYDSFESEGGPFVESFLGNVLAALGNANAVNYIDAIAFHYYPINHNRFPTIREKILEIRGIATAHGVGNLPLVVPEMGYWSDPGNGSSELAQARTLAQMYVLGLVYGVRHLDWFEPFDGGGGMETHGLFRSHNLNDPKPAYTAYAILSSSLWGLNYHHASAVSGGEAYVFRGLNGREVTAAWATAASATINWAGSCVRKTDLLGAVTTLTDGGAGDTNGAAGQIGVALSQNNTVYLAACNS